MTSFLLLFCTGDDSDSFDRSAEISEIDARLARLQQMMKNSID